MHPQLLFISGPEIIIAFLAVLLLFGADKIPGFARELGKGIREFRRVTGEIKREFEESTEEVKKDIDDIQSDVKETTEEMTGEFRSYIDDSDVVQDLKDVNKDLKG
ncbi:MAG: twin-arginine translocase TatA/TatE family subunit [Bacteroidales bacterium]|nr:twin-arginine translocase TatA/TatE family subunit [Bacteroidales bacterium]